MVQQLKFWLTNLQYTDAKLTVLTNVPNLNVPNLNVLNIDVPNLNFPNLNVQNVPKLNVPNVPNKWFNN